MIDKLQAIEDRYVDLSQKISDPNIISNVAEWRKYVKEHAAIEDIVLKYREYKKVLEDIEATKSCCLQMMKSLKRWQRKNFLN